MRAIDAILERNWAITSDMLQKISKISLRNGVEDWPKYAGEMGLPLEYTYNVQERDGIAILPLKGALFPKANLIGAASGATSLEMISHDLASAVKNPQIKCIILDVDSPGGVANGPAELAEEVRAANAVKPVVAYVRGLACSAAYWIACAAGEIVTHKSAYLGSIGVVTAMPYQETPDQNGDMYVEIVSSNAKNKRPDPRTDEGLKEIRRELDALEDQFIGTVAEYRNVSRETVITQFGNGGVLVGADAVRVGMADRIGSLEELIQTMSSSTPSGGNPSMTDKTKPKAKMSAGRCKAKYPKTYDAIFSAGAEAERKRMNAIDKIAKPGHEALVAKAKTMGWSAGKLAKKIIAAEVAQGEIHLDNLKANAAKIPAVKPSNAPEAEATYSPEDEGYDEEKAQAAWKADKNLQKEFGGKFEHYAGWLKGSSKGTLRSKSRTK